MDEKRRAISRKMRERRRDFHRYPETGWTEFRTTAVIYDVLEELDIPSRFGRSFFRDEDIMGRDIDVAAEKERAIRQGANPLTLEEMGAFTGLAAEIETGRPGPVTVLRFDIDCVDVTENCEDSHLPAREGFASLEAGRAHACAHDGHAAIGLALAELLKAQAEEGKLRGRVRLLFQPAEEGVRGGYAMTQAGLVDDADNFIALHLGIGLDTGQVSGGIHGFLSTTKLDAEFLGRSAHAGGEPHRGRNALLGAANAALSLHGIAPHAGPMRVNVGVLNAGDGRNVVPQRAVMKIETRGADDVIASYVLERANEILKGAAQMYALTLTVRKVGEANSTDSSPALAALVSAAARSVPAVTEVSESHSMPGSDDACWMMKRVQERGGLATYVGIGAAIAAGHHNDRFDFDENAMDIALEVLLQTLQKLQGT